MLRMEKTVIEKALGKDITFLSKRVVKRANGEIVRIYKAIALSEDSFILKYKVI